MARRKGIISFAAGAAIVLATATAAPSIAASAAAKPVKAASGTSGLSTTEKQFIGQVGATEVRNQAAISAFRSWMITRPGFASSGYMGSIDDLAHKATTLMWYGPRTAQLAAIVREGGRRGIRIGIQQRKYSLQQLTAAERAVWRQAAAGKWAGFKIAAIATLSATDDGITVEGSYTATPASGRAPQVRSLSATVMGVPVHITPNRSVVPLTSRDTDVAAFNSGGLMETYYPTGSAHGTAYCTSGFSIAVGGVTHATTAAHCDSPRYGSTGANYWVTTEAAGDSSIPQNEDYGSTRGTEQAATGAQYLSGTGFYWMFHDGWASSNVADVIGFEDLGVNDSVCTEGALSGEHCNNKVTSLSVYISIAQAPSGGLETIEAAQQTSGAGAVAEGDSGGPVMSLTRTSSGEVRAAGMIQAGGGATKTCSTIISPTASCYVDVYFTSTRGTVCNISGATLVTSAGDIACHSNQ